MNSKTILTGRRASGLAAAAIALALALASTALAAPTTIPKRTTGLNVNAAPGTQNDVSIYYGVAEQYPDGFHRDAHFITDMAGLVVVPGEGQICSQPMGNTTQCGDTGTTAGIPDGATGTGENPSIYLGDQADTLVSDNVGDLRVYGGSGDDELTSGSRPVVVGAFEGEDLGTDPSSEYFYGQGGDDDLKGNGQPDLLDGGKGRDKIDGGKGRDTLDGGGGNDLINARDGQKDRRIDCGPGNDKAKVDKADPEPVSC